MEKDILKQLYQKYRKEIYLYLYSLCKNSSLAEDLLQETFLKALLSLPDDHTNMHGCIWWRAIFFSIITAGKKRKYRLVKCNRYRIPHRRRFWKAF